MWWEMGGRYEWRSRACSVGQTRGRGERKAQVCRDDWGISRGFTVACGGAELAKEASVCEGAQGSAVRGVERGEAVVALDGARLLAGEAQGEERSGRAAVTRQHRRRMSNEASGDGTRKRLGIRPHLSVGIRGRCRGIMAR